MDDKVNLADAFARLDQPFRPLIVAEYNENKVTVAKTEGEFVWHKHDDTDDFFLVLNGELTIQLRDQGRGVRARRVVRSAARRRHCPRSEGGAELR